MLTILLLLVVTATIIIFISNILFGKKSTRRATIIVLYKIAKYIPSRFISWIPTWLFKMITKDHFEIKPKNDIYEKFKKIDPKKILKFKDKYAKHKMFNGVSVVLGRDKEKKYIILVCDKTPRYERWTHDQISLHLHLQKLSRKTLVIKRKSFLSKQKLIPMRGSLTPYLVDLIFFERPPKQKKRRRLRPPAMP